MLLKLYQCHKTVGAGKIIQITDSHHLVIEDLLGRPLTVEVPDRFFSADSQKVPAVGDYYVVYEDGYASWSPAKAFEEGYSKI